MDFTSGRQKQAQWKLDRHHIMYLPRDDPIIIIIKPSKGSGGLRESNRKKREARWLLDPRAQKKWRRPARGPRRMPGARAAQPRHICGNEPRQMRGTFLARISTWAALAHGTLIFPSCVVNDDNGTTFEWHIWGNTGLNRSLIAK